MRNAAAACPTNMVSPSQASSRKRSRLKRAGDGLAVSKIEKWPAFSGRKLRQACASMAKTCGIDDDVGCFREARQASIRSAVSASGARSLASACRVGSSDRLTMASFAPEAAQARDCRPRRAARADHDDAAPPGSAAGAASSDDLEAFDIGVVRQPRRISHRAPAYWRRRSHALQAKSSPMRPARRSCAAA